MVGTLVIAAWAALGQSESAIPVEYAYRLVEAHLSGAKAPISIPSAPSRGVFVTIEISGTVVGCRGSLEPLGATLAESIQRAALSASLHDPRYGRVKTNGKPFAVTLTIVDRVEPIADVSSLKPDQGLALFAGDKVGVVLPYEGRDPNVRLQWAYRKAGVPIGTDVRLKRVLARRARFPETTK